MTILAHAIVDHDGIAKAPSRGYPPRRAVIGWVLFDWAAQPYFSLITTFVFAPYFATHVAASPAQGQAMWGFATAAAGLVIAPCLARADDSFDDVRAYPLPAPRNGVRVTLEEIGLLGAGCLQYLQTTSNASDWNLD